MDALSLSIALFKQLLSAVQYIDRTKLERARTNVLIKNITRGTDVIGVPKIMGNAIQMVVEARPINREPKAQFV